MAVRRLIAVITLLLTTTVQIGASTYDLGQFQLTLSTKQPPLLTLSDAKQGRSKALRAELGLSIPVEDLARSTIAMTQEGKLQSVKFGNSMFLEIEYPNEACTQFTWSTPDLPEARDCVAFGTANWYGGPEQKEQLWPIEKLVKQDYVYVTQERDNMGIAERIWINSDGIYFYIVPEVPLFIDSNATGDSLLCFIAKFQQPYLTVPMLMLRYSVCSLPDAVQAQNHYVTVTRSQAFPRAVPDQRMVEHPIWSTWARYKQDINETVVEQFAMEIITNGYNNSQIEIDDFWETCYGELTFDTEKFPSPVNLTRKLKAMGFRVTLWVHPFVNFDCPSFEGWRRLGFYVQDENGNVQTQWWNGLNAAIIDFTNPEAATWYVNRLLELKNSTEIDSFKYDAGETSWLPDPRILTGDPAVQPNIYSSSYVRALDKPELGAISEIRSGFETQDLPTFVRMVDKDTHWTISNGLRSLVTTLLAMNMAGYSIVLPDMIGGNGYGSDAITPELFVRWLQATTFMPSLQFSYVPWQFGDNQTNEISKKFVDLHALYTPSIMNAMNKSVAEGHPVNSPVFYAAFQIDSDLPEIYAIDDQYMLGNEILVAPVMDEGATSRHVYLPSGTWQDLNNGSIYNGAQWLRDYPAPLDVLPYFMNVTLRNSAEGAAPFMNFIAFIFISLCVTFI